MTFRMNARATYLDHNASAPLLPEAQAVADACRADYAYLAQHKIAA